MITLEIPTNRQYLFDTRHPSSVNSLITNRFNHRCQHSTQHRNDRVGLEDGRTPLSRVGNTEPWRLFQNVRVRIGPTNIVIVPNVSGRENRTKDPGKGNGQNDRKE